jgi:hypothetical protein
MKFFIIYVPSQQPQGQLQTEHSVDTSDYIMDMHSIKSKTNYRQALEENTLMQTSKQTNNNNNNNNNTPSTFPTELGPSSEPSVYWFQELPKRQRIGWMPWGD